MRSIPVVVVLAVALAVVPARAEGERNPTTGKVLSGVGAGVSSALLVSSFLFGDRYGSSYNEPLFYSGLASSVITPSLGQWYGGQWVTIGMGVRAGAAGLATFAVFVKSDEVRCNNTEQYATCKSLSGAAVALLGVAAIAYIGGAAYDVITAPDAVERYNKRRRGLALSPTVIPTSTTPTAGLMLSGAF
ncbi:MAG: hypothetical protein AB7P03_17645 [Kofleriaceae bacterium]